MLRSQRAILFFLFAASLEAVSFGQTVAPPKMFVAKGRLTTTEFIQLMKRLATGWNEGSAKMAAACFSEDAQYSAPPSPSRIGRRSLFEYFGGVKGREFAMHMEWHHLIFDEKRQIGMGEYTFKYRTQTHGVVVVKINRGLINNWREYEIESDLPWDKFVGTNRF